MKETLVFHQIYYDTQTAAGGATNISFFQNNDADDERVTEMHESAAVQWLFQREAVMDLFFSQFFSEKCNLRLFFNKAEPFTSKNKKPGDIDLMLVDIARPDRVIAFECKRVMAITKPNGDSVAKHMDGPKLIKGIIQANSYQGLGFFQTYLLVIILDDSRYKLTPNTIVRNTEPALISEVYDIPHNGKLHENVGVVYVRITQPTGKHINLSAGVGICVDKRAREQEQQVSITNKIKELIKNP